MVLFGISVNSATDTSDLLGCYTKAHIKSDVIKILQQLKNIKCFRLKENLKNIQIIKKITHEIFEIDKYKSQIESTDIEIFNNFKTDVNFINLINFIQLHVNELENEAKLIEEDLLKIQILKDYKNLNMKLKRTGNEMKFEWIDSDLVQAIRNGDWVLKGIASQYHNLAHDGIFLQFLCININYKNT